MRRCAATSTQPTPLPHPVASTWAAAGPMPSRGHIAQWLERLTADQQVPGSIPGVPSMLPGVQAPGHLPHAAMRAVEPCALWSHAHAAPGHMCYLRGGAALCVVFPVLLFTSLSLSSAVSLSFSLSPSPVGSLSLSPALSLSGCSRRDLERPVVSVIAHLVAGLVPDGTDMMQTLSVLPVWLRVPAGRLFGPVA